MTATSRRSAQDFRKMEGPALDIWSAAAICETFSPQEILRTWLDRNPGASKQEQRGAMQATLEVQSTLDLQGSSGWDMQAETASHFALPAAVRLTVLQALGVERARESVKAIHRTKPTRVERAFAALLNNEPIALNRNDRDALAALATAAPWAAAAGAKLPISVAEVTDHLNRSDFIRTLAGPDLHRFVGRDSVRRQLTDAWQIGSDFPEPILIEGPGGIGKSFLIGRFIADLLDSEAGRRPDAVFHIDFDRRALQSARPSTILQELVRQTRRWWVSEETPALEELLREVSFGGATADELGSQVRGVEARQDLRPLVQRLVDLLPGRRLILFVDSHEQVDGFDRQAARAPAQIAELLSRAGAHPLSIYASRAFLNPGTLSDERPVRLQQFRALEADVYLINEAARSGIYITKSIARKVREAVGRAPLSLRLAVGLLERQSRPFNTRQWADLARESPERIQAVLYDRLLLRIRDPELRKIARPGLLLRRLTTGIIQEVLRAPCELDLSNRSPAELMQSASREGQLFVEDPADPDALWHRPDVRALMLEHLDASISAPLARRINEAAVTYYARHGQTTVERTEEFYHRLRLNQPGYELDQCWTPEVGRALRRSLGELPPEARDYMRSKLLLAASELLSAPANYSAGTTPLIIESSPAHLEELRRTITVAQQSGDDVQGLRQILERVELNRIDGPLGDVYGQTLLREGRSEDFLDGARSLLSRSTKAADRGARAAVMSTAAAILEGRSRLSEALVYWVDSSAYAPRLKQSDVALGALVGCVRIRRKLGTLLDVRQNELQSALSLVHEHYVSVAERRVLARETAAELAEVILRPDRLLPHMTAHCRVVTDLVRSVLEAGEAFPTAIEDPQRRRQISETLGWHFDTISLRELSDLALKATYAADGLMQLLLPVLREEVDITLARAADAPNRYR